MNYLYFVDRYRILYNDFYRTRRKDICPDLEDIHDHIDVTTTRISIDEDKFNEIRDDIPLDILKYAKNTNDEDFALWIEKNTGKRVG